MKFYRIAIVVGVFLLVGKYSSAVDIYIAQNAAGANSGAGCADAHAASWFNSANNWGTGAAQIGPGGTVHICGTITGSAGATVLTFQGSGSAANPITLQFESGAIVQAPYCRAAGGGSPGGCISANAKSYIVIDGNGNTGTVQNTLNGAPGATCPGGACSYQATSTLLDIQNCNNCTVQDLNVTNNYIEVQNQASENSTNEVAILLYGSNQTLANNVFTNCGWCVNFFYANGNTNFQAYGNTFTTFGHAFAVAPSASGAACGAPCTSIHDNVIGPANTNWDASGCPNHKDGIHYFGAGSSSQNGTYIYNNQFSGQWGTCSTGFIYTDHDDPYIKDLYMWNNVFQVATTTENTNGWVLVSNDGGGVLKSLNNTFIGSGKSDNSLAFAYYSNGNLTIEGNVTTGIGDPLMISGAITQADNNLYGATVCGNGGNCFIWGGSFAGSLSSWKTACNCDAHSISNSSPGVNADGTLASTSVARNAASNLSSSATGSMATLAKDTTNGGTRTASLRPTSGNWDIGAFAYATASSTPSAPTNLVASPQ
jgi:hypothetical protein